jgi:acyl-CoA thioester hydrolase
MARVQIDIPTKIAFSTNMSVRAGDVVAGVHLGNHILISYLNHALTQFFDKHKVLNLRAYDNVSVINADLIIRFLSESQLGHVLKIDISIGELHKYGVDLYYKVTNQNTGKDAAEAKMTMLFFDYQARKPVLVPNQFKELVDNQHDQECIEKIQAETLQKGKWADAESVLQCRDGRHGRSTAECGRRERRKRCPS